MSTTFARRMILGAVAAVAVATLASGCGAAKNQAPAGNPSGGHSATTKPPKGGGSGF